MTVKITSPTDTPEQVNAALGKDAPKGVETPAAPKTEAAKVEGEEVEQRGTTENVTAEESAVDEEQAALKEGDPPPKKKGGFQKKIDKLTRRAQDAELENAHLKRALEARGEPAKTAAPAAPVDTAGKPDPNKYDTHAEYIEALADWKVEQKLAARQKADEQKAEAEKKQARVESWKARTDAAKEAHEDFDEVMQSDVPVSQVMTDLMLESEVGAEMAYFLGKNPEEAKRIAKLPPTAAAREMGRIEARLEKPKEEGATAKAEGTTSVKPKPVAPVTGRATPTTTKDPDKMTYQEFKKWRETQLAAPARS